MAMGRVYKLVIDAVAVSAVQDLVTILAGATYGFELHSIEFGQKTLTAWEAKELIVYRLTPTVTVTGGTSATPAKVNEGDAAFGGTCTINNTTVATTSGSSRKLLSRDWEFLNGFYWSPAGVEDRDFFLPNTACCIRLPTAPSGTMTVSGTVSFAEIG